MENNTKQTLTVLAYIYNEEYLLPFWLEHHRTLFDHGIIVDYASTDRSMEIVKEMCPLWKIIPSKNTSFTYQSDEEMSQIEETVTGYKIHLNVTEFFICDPHFKEFLNNETMKNIEIGNASFDSYSKNTSCKVNTMKELFHHIECFNIRWRSPRYLHCYPRGNYNPGRHSNNHPIDRSSCTGVLSWQRYSSDHIASQKYREHCDFVPAVIGNFYVYPWNDAFIKRKLQVKDKMIPGGWGSQHFWGMKELEDFKKDHLEKNCFPLSALTADFPFVADTIEKYTTKE